MTRNLHNILYLNQINFFFTYIPITLTLQQSQWQSYRQESDLQQLGTTAACWPFLSYNFYSQPNQESKNSSLLQNSIKRRGIWYKKCLNQKSRLLVTIFFTYSYYCVKFYAHGTGYTCELINSKILRICTAYNHDIIFQAPKEVLFLQSPNSLLKNVLKTFICSSWNLSYLRNFTEKIRKHIRFNHYEYRGLLFSKEIQRRKLTKRKTR